MRQRVTNSNSLATDVPFCTNAAMSRLTILLVDANGRRAGDLTQLLAETGDYRVHQHSGGLGLAEQIAALNPDIVLIDMNLPDRDTLEGLRQVSTPCPVVLMAEQSDSAFVEEAIEAGVCSYHVGGVDAGAVRPILTAAVALFRRYQQTASERDAVAAQLEARRIIEKAKSLLIQKRKMSEPDAYRWLRSKAMRESRKLADVAADVLAEAGETP